MDSSAFPSEAQIKKLGYHELRTLARVHGLTATGKREEIRERLLQWRAEFGYVLVFCLVLIYPSRTTSKDRTPAPGRGPPSRMLGLCPKSPSRGSARLRNWEQIRVLEMSRVSNAGMPPLSTPPPGATTAPILGEGHPVCAAAKFSAGPYVAQDQCL
ncbi:hypothetical protein DFH11DRAFT_1746465 [Phellopilus nigrolimitatus]|nr:hypothetical protein DFH11DRAFT_1746465 [Phellopilus nigrolimitatus]